MRSILEGPRIIDGGRACLVRWEATGRRHPCLSEIASSLRPMDRTFFHDRLLYQGSLEADYRAATPRPSDNGRAIYRTAAEPRATMGSVLLFAGMLRSCLARLPFGRLPIDQLTTTLRVYVPIRSTHPRQAAKRG